MEKKTSEYEASLKSIETENYVDRIFYRPIGFQIARLLKSTGVTPNMITILSIFVGVSAGILFYYADIHYTILGILLLIFANILDCVDGQLARLTGIKSEIGRILDGVAGMIWFLCIYIALALKLGHEYGHTGIFILIAVFSGISHEIQANITDYYKTLHLFFISKEKGSEFISSEKSPKNSLENQSFLVSFLKKIYEKYCNLQKRNTPVLQTLLQKLDKSYGSDIPENIRKAFRKRSQGLMKTIDLLTFNGRTLVLFALLLSGYVWVYFVYEIIVLNIILAVVIKRHERMCNDFIEN